MTHETNNHQTNVNDSVQNTNDQKKPKEIIRQPFPNDSPCSSQPIHSTQDSTTETKDSANETLRTVIIHWESI